MKKKFAKVIVSLITVIAVCAALMCVSVSAAEPDVQKVYGVRETVITKYFTVDGQPVVAGAGCKFNIYAEVEGVITLIGQAETDENGCFDLSNITAVNEYMGFTDGNLHPDSPDSKTVYIVDTESLENPENVSVDNINDEGQLSNKFTYEKIQAATVTIDGKEVPCVTYTFSNFYHVNLAGWRVGKDNIEPQFTIRGESEVAVARSNWAYEWGLPIGIDRCFPSNGVTYYVRYSCEGNVFSFEFATDKAFENSTILCAPLEGASNSFTHALIWMRVRNGFTVTGEFEGNTFTCVGGEGGYYDQANYPLLLPVDSDNFCIEGSVEFHYDEEQLSNLVNLNGNEDMNFQIKALYLPACSADFVSTEAPEEPEIPEEEPEEDPETPIDPPMTDTVERDPAPQTGDARDIIPMLTVMLAALICLAFTSPTLIKSK